MADGVKGNGTREDPWVLKTPPGSSEFTAFRDETLDPPALVVQVGKTELRYDLRCLDDLHAMLARTGIGCRWAVPTSRSRRLDPPALVVQVGTTELRYDLRCLDDLHAMLKEQGDWVPLGSADEQKPAAEGTVEAWGRSSENPVGGWYGLKKGLRGRFGMYVPPVMEALGLAEVEHNPRNNRMRSL